MVRASQVVHEAASDLFLWAIVENNKIATEKGVSVACDTPYFTLAKAIEELFPKTRPSAKGA
jgi:hypothetical protein